MHDILISQKESSKTAWQLLDFVELRQKADVNIKRAFWRDEAQAPPCEGAGK